MAGVVLKLDKLILKQVAERKQKSLSVVNSIEMRATARR